MTPRPQPATPHDPELSQLLRSWQVQPRLPQGFASKVRQRILRTHTHSRRESWLGLALEVVERLRQPRFAIAYVSGLILLGAVSGSWQAQGTSSADSLDLQSRYLASIDPYQMPRPQGGP